LEHNPESLAAVTEDDDLSTYWQACFWGGRSEYFLKVSKELEERTDKDLEKNIIAKFWDESFLNKYFIENKNLVYTYDPSYSYPATRPIPGPFKKKIVHDEDPKVMGKATSIKNTLMKDTVPGYKRPD